MSFQCAMLERSTWSMPFHTLVAWKQPKHNLWQLVHFDSLSRGVLYLYLLEQCTKISEKFHLLFFRTKISQSCHLSSLVMGKLPLSLSPQRRRNLLFWYLQCNIKNNTKKPERIDFYNSTKSGVDTFNVMVHAYSASRCTRRWPLRMLYGIFDQADINALMLYKFANPGEKSYKEEFFEKFSSVRWTTFQQELAT